MSTRDAAVGTFWLSPYGDLWFPVHGPKTKNQLRWRRINPANFHKIRETLPDILRSDDAAAEADLVQLQAFPPLNGLDNALRNYAARMEDQMRRVLTDNREDNTDA